MCSGPRVGATPRKPVPGHPPGAGFFQLCVTALLALALVGSGPCGPKKESEDRVPVRDIITVQEAHTSDLMAIPNVVGVAVGALDDGTPCILVLVVKETDEIKRKVPRKLEGHPVRILVSGEIKPMQSD
jgi:hypothetical protein